MSKRSKPAFLDEEGGDGKEEGHKSKRGGRKHGKGKGGKAEALDALKEARMTKKGRRSKRG